MCVYRPYKKTNYYYKKNNHLIIYIFIQNIYMEKTPDEYSVEPILYIIL